jgi:hypothetical protein
MWKTQKPNTKAANPKGGNELSIVPPTEPWPHSGDWLVFGIGVLCERGERNHPRPTEAEKGSG